MFYAEIYQAFREIKFVQKELQIYGYLFLNEKMHNSRCKIYYYINFKWGYGKKKKSEGPGKSTILKHQQ